jgi:hypothetical protein
MEWSSLHDQTEAKSSIWLTRRQPVTNRRYDIRPQRARRALVRQLVIIGLFSATVVIVTFFAGAGLYPGFARLTGADSDRVDWSLLDGYVSLLTLALIVGGLVFAFVEYVRSESEQARDNAQISFGIYQALSARMTHPEEEAARRWIIQTIPKRNPDQSEDEWLALVRQLIQDKPQDWQDQLAPGQQHVKQVLNTLDFMGFVATHYWNVEGPLLEWMSPPVAKVWERIGPYVVDEAKRRSEPDFYKSARSLGERCVNWRKGRGLPEPAVVQGTV